MRMNASHPMTAVRMAFPVLKSRACRMAMIPATRSQIPTTTRMIQPRNGTTAEEIQKAGRLSEAQCAEKLTPSGRSPQELVPDEVGHAGPDQPAHDLGDGSHEDRDVLIARRSDGRCHGHHGNHSRRLDRRSIVGLDLFIGLDVEHGGSEHSLNHVTLGHGSLSCSGSEGKPPDRKIGPRRSWENKTDAGPGCGGPHIVRVVAASPVSVG